MSSLEEIGKLKFNIEKCKVLLIGFQNIKVEYELNKEIKKVNEEYDLGFGFDDAFKADNHIFDTGSLFFIKMYTLRNFHLQDRSILYYSLQILYFFFFFFFLNKLEVCGNSVLKK